MRILTTPESVFAGTPGWPAAPRHVDVGGLRMAVVMEGPADAAPIVLLHGEPTWGYLWRTVAAHLVASGHRVVVPDLVGFGRSDKPADVAAHTVDAHLRWLQALLDALGVHRATLVGHDWGGLFGLRVLADRPDRFARLVLTNTFLPTGHETMTDEWLAFRNVVRRADQLDVGRLVQAGCTGELDAVTRAAYDAPFPTEEHKAGPRALPDLVPDDPEHPEGAGNRTAWKRLGELDVPVRCVWGADDRVTTGADLLLAERLPGARGQDHVVVDGAGHFIQEDRPAELADAVVGFVAATR